MADGILGADVSSFAKEQQDMMPVEADRPLALTEARRTAAESLGIEPNKFMDLVYRGQVKDPEPEMEAMRDQYGAMAAEGEPITPEEAVSDIAPVDVQQPTEDQIIANQYVTSILSPPSYPAYEGIKEAVRQGYALESEKAKAEAQAIEDQQRKQEEIETERQLLELDRAEALGKRATEIDTLTTELGSIKIDPNRLYANASTGNKILAGISILLGAVGSGPKGQNQALKIITDAIDNDIAAQKANFAAKKSALAEKKSAYAMAKGQFDSEIEALNAARLIGLERTKNEIAARASKYKSEAQKIEAAKAIGAIELEQQKTRQQFLQNAGAKYMKAQDQALEKQKENEELFIPGFGVARSDKAWNQFAEKAGEYQGQKATLDSLISDVDTYGVSDSLALQSDLRKRIDTMTTMLRGQLRTLFVGPGALTEKEMDILIDAIPSGATWNPVTRKKALAALNTLRDAAKNKIQQEAKIYVKDYKPLSQKQKEVFEKRVR